MLPDQPGQGFTARKQFVGGAPRGWNKPAEQRTGLVLSGGGLKFAVHTGLYSRMAEIPCYEGLPQLSGGQRSDFAGLPVLSEAFDVVVGTSAGSLLAAAMAAGLCAEDAARISVLFSHSKYHNMVLDPDWLGAGSFLLRGDLGYIKGLYQGQAIRRTLEAVFSHNFLSELGDLYAWFGHQRLPVDGPVFEQALVRLIRRLRSLPRESLPQTPGYSPARENTDALRYITFQDINPGARVPYERFEGMGLGALDHEAMEQAETRYSQHQAHAGLYREALAAYYAGRLQAGRNPPPGWDNLRPLLLVVGTDLITGQKTIFCNYHLFEKQLVYNARDEDSIQRSIAYRYINPAGDLAPLPPEISEELRPANFLYRQLTNGLPLAWSVRASLSIPGVFAPAQMRYLDDTGVERTDFFIDGGVTDNYALQVAADETVGRCGRILGGNIGNLGRRVHNYGVRSALEILLQTLYVQGDANVDANADNRLVKTARVATITELTRANVTSLRQLKELPNLYREGLQLADQFFGTLRDRGSGALSLDRLFSWSSHYMVFLPRVETYGLPPEAPVPPPPLVPDGCAATGQGASEIDRLVEEIRLSPEERLKIRRERSEVLGACEAGLTPPPVTGPGLLARAAQVEVRPGQRVRPLPAADLVSWARRGALAVLLSFATVVSLLVWRAALYGWQAGGLLNTLAGTVDNWGMLHSLGAVLAGAVWCYLIFFRLFIYEYWIARGSRLARRLMEIPFGLFFYLWPLLLLERAGGLTDWRPLAAALLVPLSSLALLFSLYASLALLRSLTGRSKTG